MDIDIIHPAIERYLDELLPDRELWFIEMEKMAEEEGFPAVGPRWGCSWKSWLAPSMPGGSWNWVLVSDIPGSGLPGHCLRMDTCC